MRKAHLSEFLNQTIQMRVHIVKNMNGIFSTERISFNAITNSRRQTEKLQSQITSIEKQ